MTSEVPPGWTMKRIGDLARVVTGATPKGKNSEHFGDAVPFLTPSDIPGRIKQVRTERFLSQAGAKAFKKKMISKGTPCFVAIGSTIGKTCVAPDQTLTNQQIHAAIPIPTAADTDFLYYALTQHAKRMRQIAGGSATPIIKKSAFEAFEIPAPCLHEQRRIARVLGSLDDKIENNRRIARAIEEIAATLFKAHFVDFVDYDDLVESEIGPIPRGWDIAPIGEVLSVVGGSTPSTKEPVYWSGGRHCWATPKDLSGLDEPILLDTARHITDAGVERISSGLLPARTVLMSSRAPVGYTAISFVPTAVNQGFIAVPPSDEVPSEYVLFWMRENMNRIKANAGGTTFAEISKRAFRPLPMLVPPGDVLNDFKRVASRLTDRIGACVRENASLAAIRDALLPRLISGEIRVPVTRSEDTSQ